MNKQEYLGKLREALACLPEDEIEGSTAFYAEMIDDRMADGMAEDEAVAQLDDPKAAARAIIADLPPVPRAAARTKRKSRALYWTLVILGSPLWLTLLLAGAVVVLAGVIVVWSLIFALWALAAGLLVGGPAGVVMCVWGLAWGQPAYAAVELGAGLVCLGLGLFCLHGVMAASKALAEVSRQWVDRARALFVRRKTEMEGDAADAGSAISLTKEAVHEF